MLNILLTPISKGIAIITGNMYSNTKRSKIKHNHLVIIYHSIYYLIQIKGRKRFVYSFVDHIASRFTRIFFNESLFATFYYKNWNSISKCISQLLLQIYIKKKKWVDLIYIYLVIKSDLKHHLMEGIAVITFNCATYSFASYSVGNIN